MKNKVKFYFPKGHHDALSLSVISDFNMSSYNHKGPRSYKDREDIEERINMQTLSIKSLFKENLFLSVNYSTTYSTSPNIKAIFTGYDHRSWIDIFISYKDIFKDNLLDLFDKKYLYKTIQVSDNLEPNYIINTLPNSSDNVLIFLPDNPKNCGWNTLDMTIRGKSSQTFNSWTSQFSFTATKITLWWNVQLQGQLTPLYSLSLQGDSHQLEAHFVPKCGKNKPFPVLKIYWIPDQLTKYRRNALNKPHGCLQLSQDTFTLYSCLNFSSDSTKQNYYTYRSLHDGFTTNIEKSWNYASSVCKDMGGFLPVIRSKSELDEFIAFIALSPHLPPQQRIFIGLSTITKSKL